MNEGYWRVHCQLCSSSTPREDPLIVRWCRHQLMQICRLFYHLQNVQKSSVEPQIWYPPLSPFSCVEIVFTVSLKRSDSLFCLLIDPHDSPSRRLLRWSHPRSPSRWTPPPKEGEGSPATSSCLFPNVMSDIHGGWPEVYFPGSTLPSEKRRVKADPRDGSAD